MEIIGMRDLIVKLSSFLTNPNYYYQNLGNNGMFQVPTIKTF